MVKLFGDDGIMKTINRKSIMITNMNDFDYLATNDSYLEVTAYGNGEDCYDIKTDEESFSVSKGQVEDIVLYIPT